MTVMQLTKITIGKAQFLQAVIRKKIMISKMVMKWRGKQFCFILLTLQTSCFLESCTKIKTK